MPAPDHFFWHWLDPRCVNDEPDDQVAQVEAVVEPVDEGTEVGLGVLAVLQRFEGTRHHGLEVTQHGADPLELGQVRRAHITASVAHWMSLLRQVSKQDSI